MNKNNNPTPSFANVRKEFYKQAKGTDRKKVTKIIFIAVAVLLLASTILFLSAYLESSNKDKYVFVYGDYKQSISNELCFIDDIRMIDMNALANYCEFEKEEANSFVTFKHNGTFVTFENNSKNANVNGIKKELPVEAQIKNGYCLIPLSTANELLFGVTMDIGKKEATVTKSDTMYIIDKNPQISNLDEYLDYINSTDEYIHILLNKQNPIDEEFTPTNLVQIPETYLHQYKHGTEIFLEATTMKALEAMLKDMAASGIDDIFVQSAYRTHSYQNMLFNMYIEREMQAGLSKEEATIKANKYSARPEYSEHRTGLCVDFTTNSIHGAVDDVFETTEAFQWLKDNSWKYGFVMRYPEDKEDVTGYMYESWHYRFVGLKVASTMYQTGLCYEEYLEIFENQGE